MYYSQLRYILLSLQPTLYIFLKIRPDIRTSSLPPSLIPFVRYVKVVYVRPSFLLRREIEYTGILNESDEGKGAGKKGWRGRTTPRRCRRFEFQRERLERATQPSVHRQLSRKRIRCPRPSAISWIVGSSGTNRSRARWRSLAQQVWRLLRAHGGVVSTYPIYLLSIAV